MRSAILTTSLPAKPRAAKLRLLLLASCLAVTAVVLWKDAATFGNPNSFVTDTTFSAAILDITVLVFREGLECVLVLAAVMAGMDRDRAATRTPIVIGAAAGFAATLLTWAAAARILNELSQSISALALQAATGLLAVIVSLIVMNWFFHRLYWTGWISLHTRRKRALLGSVDREQSSGLGFFWGMGVLGFTSLYREGIEVVLFLQSYRLRLGNEAVLWGACIGIFLSGIVAILTFVAHRKLPYRKMLVLTGTMLGAVLIVMVGEQAQEMQLAHWIPTTTIRPLAHFVPGWMGLWFSISPAVETLLAQLAAALLVLGSYAVASRRVGVVQSTEV